MPIYPSCKATQYKQKSRKKFGEGGYSPCINYLTVILRGPALTVFAFPRYARQTKTSLWASNPYATPSSWRCCQLPYKLKIPPKMGVFLIYTEREGFEPSIPFQVYSLSRTAP